MIGIATFGDKRLNLSLQRFRGQAQKMGAFDVISVNTEDNLSPSFRALHSGRLNKETRGFGYWCWKPYIVLKTLEKNPELEILFYADVGCHINAGGKGRLLEYIDILRKSQHDILAFSADMENSSLGSVFPPASIYIERQWTKGDMFAHFALSPDSDLANSEQIHATIFAVKNNAEIRAFLQEWCDIMASAPHLFDDSPSKQPNSPDFSENRHDQSYFSLSVKKRGWEGVSLFEIWPRQKEIFGIFVCDWSKVKHCPFHAKRDTLQGGILSQFGWHIRRFIKYMLSSFFPKPLALRIVALRKKIARRKKRFK